MSEFHHLFQPIMIGPLEVPNRICFLATDINSSHSADGQVSARDIWHIAEVAKGGTGLVIVGATTVNRKTNHCAVGDLAADDDSLIPGLAKLADACHRYGAAAFIQLVHAGRQTALPRAGKLATNDQILTAPALPGKVVHENDSGEDERKIHPPMHELTTDEVYDIAEEFGEAAWRCKTAGFDGVELHAAHGYLLSCFLSAFINRRTDRFGGSLENRMRLPLLVVRVIHAKCGKDFPIGVRYNCEERVPGGYQLPEAVEMAKRFEEAGVAALDPSTGLAETPIIGPNPYPQKEGWLSFATEAIKKVVKIPVIIGHSMRNPDFCEKIVAEGKADMIGFCRQLLADPYWPLKAKNGKVRSIRRCISCGEGCWTESLAVKKEIACTVNPACGNEAASILTKARSPMSVAVVGGGPAGMEAARTAIMRGHTVTLFEKTAELGGAMLGCCTTPGKDEKVKWYTDWARHEIEDLKADVRLCTSPSLADLKGFDAVVNATGASSFVPEVRGLREKVVPFEEVMACPKITCEFHPNNAQKKSRQERKPRKLEGSRVLVWGDHYAAVDTATHFAAMGKQVTIVTDRKAFGTTVDAVYMYVNWKHFHLQDVEGLEWMEHYKHPVTVHEGCRIDEILDGEVVLLDREFHTKRVPYDSIVTCWTRPNLDLMRQLSAAGKLVINVGDSVKPRNIYYAVREGAQAGRMLEGGTMLNPNNGLVDELPVDVARHMAAQR